MGKDNVKQSEKLTDRQENIARLRVKLNQADPDAIKPFTKYKIITYIFNIIFPPYSLYRIWKNQSPFKTNERIVQTGVCLIYMIVLFSAFSNGGF